MRTKTKIRNRPAGIGSTGPVVLLLAAMCAVCVAPSSRALVRSPRAAAAAQKAQTPHSTGVSRALRAEMHDALPAPAVLPATGSCAGGTSGCLAIAAARSASRSSANSHPALFQRPPPFSA